MFVCIVCILYRSSNICFYVWICKYLKKIMYKSILLINVTFKSVMYVQMFEIFIVNII